MYSEYHSSIAGATLWSVIGGGQSTVVPDGCVDVIWMQDQLLAVGPMTRPITTPALSDTTIGLRFDPGVAPQLLGIGAGELTDQRVLLDSILPSMVVRQTTDQLLSGTSVAAKTSTMESLLGPRSDSILQGSGRQDVVDQMLELVASGMAVRQIAVELHLSERQLHRRSIDAFGYGLRTLGRILRFGEATRMLSRGSTPALAAIRAGYADQPHFTREFVTFAGTTPGKYAFTAPS